MNPTSNKKDFKDLSTSLRDLAYSYIEKYSPSKQQLRVYLMKKTLTKFKTSKTKKEISNLISEIISTLEKKSFLNDELYSESKSRMLLRRGYSINKINQSLRMNGIEPKWTKRIVDEIAKTGKPVEGFHIERTGDIGTIMKASKKAQEFSQWASEKQREECPLSDLWISVKCGESDTTSGLASNPTVGNLMEKLEPFWCSLMFW